jgi:protease IV
MSIDADWLVDRRRLKHRLTWWRILAVVAVMAAVIAALGRFNVVGQPAHVARIAVDGVILSDFERDRALALVASNASIKALIVHVNSPGGTVVGGEVLYRRLRQVSERKPVVAVMGELAASAAYMTALGADWIIARDGTLTGSIGVIMQTTDLTGMLEKLGIKPEAVKSSPLKAQPNPFEPFTQEARQATQEVVADTYALFVQMVQDRRQLSGEQLAEVADGRIFTGRQAQERGLVDALGGEDEARSWLERTHGIAAGLPMREVRVRGTGERLQDLLSRIAGKALLSETLSLDGLISVWHPGR